MRETGSADTKIARTTTPSSLFNVVRCTFDAFAAVTICAPMFVRRHPKTPLRVFCVAAFEYLARHRGGTLGPRVRHSMALACDFGALCDEYYDHRRLVRSDYRHLRRILIQLPPQASASEYIRQLRGAERGRPVASECGFEEPSAVNAYRRRVLEIALDWLQRISGLSRERAHFSALVRVACLVQLADDLFDWKDDAACGRPSYVTALLGGGATPGKVTGQLQVQALGWRNELIAAARDDVAVLPFAVAGLVAWGVVAVLLQFRMLR